MPPVTRDSGRIPCLDGLRAISILLVIVFHGITNQHDKGFPNIWFPFGGAAGVSLFFIISGYLITTLLLKEKKKTGSVSLTKFYIRRALRIFPPFYCYILAVLVLKWGGLTGQTMSSVLASATYWMNFYSGPTGEPNLLGHTWSLSIEEQFYLVWPICVAFLSTRRAIATAVIGFSVWPLLRLARHGYLFAPVPELALRNTGLDTILWGSVLALATFQSIPRVLAFLAHSRWSLYLSLGTLLIIYSAKESWPTELSFLLPLLRNLSLTLLLWWSIRNEESWFGRLLQFAPIAFIGTLSYSLYLWHGLFISKADWWVCYFPQGYVFSLTAAVISYYAIELPCNRWRFKFQA